MGQTVSAHSRELQSLPPSEKQSVMDHLLMGDRAVADKHSGGDTEEILPPPQCLLLAFWGFLGFL